MFLVIEASHEFSKKIWKMDDSEVAKLLKNLCYYNLNYYIFAPNDGVKKILLINNVDYEVVNDTKKYI